MNSSTTFQPIRADDESFLFRVFASTREDVMAWDAAETQKNEFLQLQFRAQHDDYQRRYVDAAFLVVLQNGKPIGRLYLHRGEQEFRIIDFALLPEFRGSGIGTSVLQGILSEAKILGRPVRMYVMPAERGAQFLKRHGFVPVSHTATHTLMECAPNGAIIVSE